MIPGNGDIEVSFARFHDCGGRQTRVLSLDVTADHDGSATSEITTPNPAMTAASSGSRASFISSQTICRRVAPKARILERRFLADAEWPPGDAHHDGVAMDGLGNDNSCGRIEDLRNRRDRFARGKSTQEPHDDGRQSHPVLMRLITIRLPGIHQGDSCSYGYAMKQADQSSRSGDCQGKPGDTQLPDQG